MDGEPFFPHVGAQLKTSYFLYISMDLLPRSGMTCSVRSWKASARVTGGQHSVRPPEVLSGVGVVKSGPHGRDRAQALLSETNVLECMPYGCSKIWTKDYSKIKSAESLQTPETKLLRIFLVKSHQILPKPWFSKEGFGHSVASTGIGLPHSKNSNRRQILASQFTSSTHIADFHCQAVLDHTPDLCLPQTLLSREALPKQSNCFTLPFYPREVESGAGQTLFVRVCVCVSTRPLLQGGWALSDTLSMANHVWGKHKSGGVQSPCEFSKCCEFQGSVANV